MNTLPMEYGNEGINNGNRYVKAIYGLFDTVITTSIPGFGTAEDLADRYRSGSQPLGARIDALIRWQAAQAGCVGFVTSLGGVATLPVSLPASLCASFGNQARMIAAIAALCNLDPQNPQYRALCVACMAGKKAAGVLKKSGVVLARQLCRQAVRNIPGSVIRAINTNLGICLVTKFGQTGLINLGRAVPLAGGLVGGSFDAASTYAVGKAAKTMFLPMAG